MRTSDVFIDAASVAADEPLKVEQPAIPRQPNFRNVNFITSNDNGVAIIADETGNLWVVDPNLKTVERLLVNTN